MKNSRKFLKKKRDKRMISLLFALLGIFVFLPADSVFAENSPETSLAVLEVQGAKEDDSIRFGEKDFRDLPMKYKLERKIPLVLGGSETERALEAVKLSQLLNEFCGVNVKEADLLFIDTVNDRCMVKAYSEIVDEKQEYVLVYAYKDFEDGGGSRALEAGGFILINKDGSVLPKKEGLFVVNKIKINCSLNEKDLPSSPPEYRDIGDEFLYAKDAIYELSKMGIIGGISESEFAPQDPLTRAYLCKIMVDVLDLSPVNYDNTFSDVKNEAWYAPYIATAVSEGLMYGFTDGSFAPDSQINRQEFATLCVEMALKSGKVSEEEILARTLKNSRFRDKDAVFGWVENSVAYLDSIGAYDPYLGEEFLPLKGVSKAEACYVIYTLLFK